MSIGSTTASILKGPMRRSPTDIKLSENSIFKLVTRQIPLLRIEKQDNFRFRHWSSKDIDEFFGGPSCLTTAESAPSMQFGPIYLSFRFLSTWPYILRLIIYYLRKGWFIRIYNILMLFVYLWHLQMFRFNEGVYINIYFKLLFKVYLV